MDFIHRLMVKVMIKRNSYVWETGCTTITLL